MKRIAIALLVSAAALAANTARAESRVRIGINIGTPVYEPAVVYAPAPSVVYAPAPAVVYAPAPVAVVHNHGYWRDVEVKTWVPERWVMSHNRWGHHVRVLEPGYYTCRTDRVWVEGHQDRGYRGGYDNRGTYGYDNGGRYDNRGGYDNRGSSGYGYDNNRGHDNRGGWNR